MIPGVELRSRIAALPARLTPTTARATLPYVAAGLLVALAVLLAGRAIDHHIAAVEAWIADLGPWGVAAFIGLYVLLTSLLLPESVVAVAGGALFGLRLGIAVVTTGALVAAAAQYALSRRVLRARVRRALDAHTSLAAIERAVIARSLRLQALLRVTPLNPATLSYLLGAAGVPFGGFMVAFLASAPHLLVEVYAGYAGRHLAHMAGRGGVAVRAHDAVVIAGLAIAGVAIVIVGRAARAAVMGAVSDAEAARGGGPDERRA